MNKDIKWFNHGKYNTYKMSLEVYALILTTYKLFETSNNLINLSKHWCTFGSTFSNNTWIRKRNPIWNLQRWYSLPIFILFMVVLSSWLYSIELVSTRDVCAKGIIENHLSEVSDESLEAIVVAVKWARFKACHVSAPEHNNDFVVMMTNYFSLTSHRSISYLLYE